MGRRPFAIITVALLLFTCGLAMNAQAGLTATAPNITEGDYWTYSMDINNVSVDNKVTVKTKNDQKNGVDCYYTESSISTTISGMSMTTNIKQWNRKTDGAQVASESYADIAGLGYSKVEITWDPPLAKYKFPMTVGSKWTSSSSATRKEEASMMGFTSNSTDTSTEEIEGEVLSEEQVTVAAGKFDTLKIKLTESGDVQYHFWAPKVGNVVLVEEEDGTDMLELKSYRYLNPGSGGGGGNGDDDGGLFGDMMMLMLIIVVIIIVVVVVVVAVVMKKKGSTPPPVQPGGPPAAQPPAQQPQYQDPYGQQQPAPQPQYDQQYQQPPQYDQQYQQPPQYDQQYQQPPQQQNQYPPQY